jgi:predicted secreted hydrolase
VSASQAMKAVAVLLAVAALIVSGLVLLSPERHDLPAASVSVTSALGGATEAGYARATAPRAFTFPADHGPHPEYRTEWWYFTGNVTTAEGRHFGYQLTFFRTALAPESDARRASAWASRQLYMAHFAVTDTAARRFHPHGRFARGALGLAGARAEPLRVSTDDWSVESASASGIGDSVAAGAAGEAWPVRLRAAEADVAIDLIVERGKPIVLQGDRGLSRKGPGEGNASYYYSLTRMPTRGTLRVAREQLAVTGMSWMDREWSTSALGDRIGWDWFALQFSDGRDLMFYRLRRADGATDAFSAGSVVAADGRSRPLGSDDVRVEALDWWTSPRGGVRYPARWRLTVPSEQVDVEIVPRLADQELGDPVRYWEGAVSVRSLTTRRPDEAGPRRARASATDGIGYVELVGYGERSREGVR